MDAVAAQVRTIDALMLTSIEELSSANAWSGPDAERFKRDWHDQVSVRLRTAAAKLDGISFTDFV
ncbi:MAG: hypothetical protein M3Y46_03125 [Actinomycetota bacterium]|jgi:hypothetical protein|nr:hypothetical protein [Actinomycetota bacterium]